MFPGPALLLLLALVLAAGADAWNLGQARRAVASLSVGLGLGLGSVQQLPALAAEEAAPSSLVQQLREMQEKRVVEQRKRLESDDQRLLSSELLLPEGALLARGILTVVSDKWDSKVFPLGFETAASLDTRFSDPSSRLFVLCVGRESSIPVAAKSFPLKDIQFPFVFELLDSDLLFPYTKEAWLASPSRVDTVAITAFFTPESKLSIANPNIRVGFALSEPVQFAGKLTRSTAAIRLGAGEAVDTSLFTPAEIALLQAVDDGIAKNVGQAVKK